MSEQRDQVVKRVIYALDSEEDPAALVRAYFDDDRAAVVEAAKETLEATDEDTDPQRLEEVVDRELIQALRLPAEMPRDLLASLYVRRRAVALASTLAAAVLVTLLVFL